MWIKVGVVTSIITDIATIATMAEFFCYKCFALKGSCSWILS